VMTGAESSIVCGVDGSPHSRAAARLAAILSERLRLRLVLLHASLPSVAPMVPTRTAAPPGIPPELELVTPPSVENGQMVLEAVAWTEGLMGADLRAVSGSPVECLLETADAEDALVIVLGSRQRSVLARLAARGVASTILRRSTRAVLLVPAESDAVAGWRWPEIDA